MSHRDTDNYLTLKPYCVLLEDYLSGCSQERDIAVFQSANLTDDMIDCYKRHVGKLAIWDWFSSTTKNKEIALSCFGNALFEIRIPQELHRSVAVAISLFSEYPSEQEVLLVNLEIKIEKVEYDPEINKHVIEIVIIGHC